MTNFLKDIQNFGKTIADKVTKKINHIEIAKEVWIKLKPFIINKQNLKKIIVNTNGIISEKQDSDTRDKSTLEEFFGHNGIMVLIANYSTSFSNFYKILSKPLRDKYKLMKKLSFLQISQSKNDVKEIATLNNNYSNLVEKISPIIKEINFKNGKIKQYDYKSDFRNINRFLELSIDENRPLFTLSNLFHYIKICTRNTNQNLEYLILKFDFAKESEGILNLGEFKIRNLNNLKDLYTNVVGEFQALNRAAIFEKQKEKATKFYIGAAEDFLEFVKKQAAIFLRSQDKRFGTNLSNKKMEIDEITDTKMSKKMNYLDHQKQLFAQFIRELEFEYSKSNSKNSDKNITKLLSEDISNLNLDI
ncbi:MAG: hypothetical protein RsTaC01_1039 [Candidatus Paraimprobicoccus trichonymphae]|uniref:Uncharacterized protein n=1 Tax=Candidatus Paraimprobicoccus trichonymphae TaxID=3033793 RepID=A0AA48IAG7_9FIRM|nr:MAG: hypothetical protein RsTaC01_1039 [Candidatus Paraimprobicoccus trichonymphae]